MGLKRKTGVIHHISALAFAATKDLEVRVTTCQTWGKNLEVTDNWRFVTCKRCRKLAPIEFRGYFC